MSDIDRGLQLLGQRLAMAVAEHSHREVDSALVGALLKHYHPSQTEITRAANACELPPTLAALRAEHCSPHRDPESGLSEEEFDAIVAAARREAP